MAINKSRLSIIKATPLEAVIFFFHIIVSLSRHLFQLWLHTSSSSSPQALREPSHESAALTSPPPLPRYANCCPTEVLVSMPPNKSLAAVSWQNETLQPPPRPLFPSHPSPQETNYSLVRDSLSLKCVHINPGLCSVYLSPLRTTGHSLILFILDLMAQ